MPPAPPPLIEFRNVWKSFATIDVIRGVDLAIPAGQVVVICGPSGSGKSTLIRLINRLEPLTRGELVVDGREVARLRARELQTLRSDVGFVFQQFNLYPHLTARDNISLALRKLLRQSDAEAGARADELLARVGLADRGQHYPAQLSGGQQQRVAIARALATRPRILLFDEPTSALDPEMIGEVLAVIRELAQSGITLLVVTHELGFAREVADRVIFLDHGVVLEDSPPADFFGATRHPRVQQFLAQLHAPSPGASAGASA